MEFRSMIHRPRRHLGAAATPGHADQRRGASSGSWVHRVRQLVAAVFAASLAVGSMAAIELGSTTPAGATAPTWTTLSGAPASSLTCGNWYIASLPSGDNAANINMIGGGGGGGASSTYGNIFVNPANTATGGAGGKTAASFKLSSGQTVATEIGCGGGGGVASASSSANLGGTGATGYANGGSGGANSLVHGVSNQSGGGGGGGSTVSCVYSGITGSPCGTLLAIAPGGGGGGGAGCTGNGGNGGNGNAGATTGSASNSEPNATAPGGAANGQGLGGGGGGADSASQSYGGGGGGGIGAVGGQTSTSSTTGGGGAGLSAAGSGGAGTSPTSQYGKNGSGANASGTGGAGGVAYSKSGSAQYPTGGGGGGGYTGGGGGTGNNCEGTIFGPSGAGGGGSGSSWASTGLLTSFSNGVNPAYTAGSIVNSQACLQHQGQSTQNANGAGGSGSSSTSSVAGGWAGCAGGTTLVFGTLPTFTSASSTSFKNGTSGQTFSVTTSADPTITSLTASGLPSGVTFSYSSGSSGTLSCTGTCTAAAGTYTITFTATNTIGSTSQTFTLAVGTPPAFTSGSTTTFTNGTSGQTFPVTTTGTPKPSITESTGSGQTGLPSGVTFTDNGNGTGTLACTGTCPVTGGTYTFTLTASNGVSPNATQSFTLKINQSPAFTSGSSTTFTHGTSGQTFSVTTTGTPTPAVAESTGSGQTGLPSGVTFTDNGNGTGTLACTGTCPVTGGVYTFTLTASNGVSPNAVQSFTLTINQAPTITSGDSTTFTNGTSGQTFSVTTTGTPTPSITESTGSGQTGLPSGVTFTDNGNGTGTLACTGACPVAPGSYTFTLTASNGVNPPATQSFTLTINQAPAFTSADATTFTNGTSGQTFTVTTTGTPTPSITESTGSGQTGLPSGVTFTDNGDGTGTLACTGTCPVTGGTYTFTLTASNGVSPDATQSFTLTINQAPAITSGASTTFTNGTSGQTYPVTTSGFPTPSITESTGSGQTGLPSGVTFTDNGDGTGTLACTGTCPVTGGTYTFTLTASNGVSPDATQSFTLTVNQAPAITSGDSTTFLNGTSGQTFTVTTTGTPTPSITESTGSGQTGLPSGVTFTDNGDGTGTLACTGTCPVTGGNYTFTLTASNGVSPDATQSFTLTIATAPTINAFSTVSVRILQNSSYTITTTGFPTPSLSEIGGLPPNMTFTDNGNGTATLSGTPQAGTQGPYNIIVIASNEAGSAHKSISLQVDQAPQFTSTATPPAFTVGQFGSFTVTTTGSWPLPVTMTAGAFPVAGLTFTDNGNGTATISGTPTKALTKQVTIAAKNVVLTNTQLMTLTINPA